MDCEDWRPNPVRSWASLTLGNFTWVRGTLLLAALGPKAPRRISSMFPKSLSELQLLKHWKCLRLTQCPLWGFKWRAFVLLRETEKIPCLKPSRSKARFRIQSPTCTGEHVEVAVSYCTLTSTAVCVHTRQRSCLSDCTNNGFFSVKGLSIITLWF